MTDLSEFHELQEVETLRQRVKQLSEGEAASERALLRIEQAVSKTRPLYKAKTFKPSSGKRRPQEMVLLLSDLHASEVVSLEETRGINEYNWEIMLSRLDGVRRAILSHKQHFGFEVEKLNVHMLGDMLSGDIHDELAITNDRPTSEAIVQLAYDTAEWLKALADEFPKIHVAGVPGNHPRATKKPQAKQAHNNGDWLFYQMVAALLRGHDQFSFDFPRGSYNIQMICDRFRTLLMHGDGIRSTMPGVPWGGVIRRVTVLEQQFNAARQPLDYVVLGHFHTQNALDGVSSKTFVNGSVKGADEYSIKQFGSGRPAAQTLLTFHPERGWTGQYQVTLQESQAASEGWVK